MLASLTDGTAALEQPSVGTKEGDFSFDRLQPNDYSSAFVMVCIHPGPRVRPGLALGALSGLALVGLPSTPAFAVTKTTTPPVAPAPPPPPPPPPSPPPPPPSILLEAEDPFFASVLLGFASQDLDFGIGGRVGKTFKNGFYVGTSFTYQTGESAVEGNVATGNGTISSSVTVSSSLFYTGGEAGYDFNLRYVVLRPFCGVGFADITTGSNITGQNVSSSVFKFVVWPGVQASYIIPHTLFFVGADVHLLTEPGGPSLGFFATGGVRFGASEY